MDGFWKGALMRSVIWDLMTWTGHTLHIMAPCILRLGSPQLRHSATKLLARAVLPCQQVLICSTIFVFRQWQSLLGSISSSTTLPHPPMSPFWSIWTVQYDAILILTTVLYLWDWGLDHLTALRFSTTSTGNWSHGAFRWLSALPWHCQQVWVKTWQNDIKSYWEMSDLDVAIKSYRIYSDGFGLSFSCFLQMRVLQLRQKLPRPKTLLGYLRLCTTPKGFQGANTVRKIPSKLNACEVSVKIVKRWKMAIQLHLNCIDLFLAHGHWKVSWTLGNWMNSSSMLRTTLVYVCCVFVVYAFLRFWWMKASTKVNCLLGTFRGIDFATSSHFIFCVVIQSTYTTFAFFSFSHAKVLASVKHQSSLYVGLHTGVRNFGIHF